MAIRKAEFKKTKSKKPKYERTSKMRRYNMFFDENTKKMHLSFYNRIGKFMKFDNRDKIYTVEPGYEYRTDLISAKFYDTSKYDWIIEDVNNIQDPIRDVVAGKKLIIPAKSKIYSLT